MEKVNLSGVTRANMMVISTKITFMDMVNMYGPMVEFTMVNGSTTKWKVKVLSHGVMEEDTLDSTKMIRSMVKEHLSGQMVECISVNGVKVSNMAKVLISKKIERD
jgi:hypothetical protein